MGLETTLTLMLAAFILVVALALRIVVVGTFRLVRLAVGHRVRARDSLEAALPSPTLHERFDRLAYRVGVATIALIRALAAVIFVLLRAVGLATIALVRAAWAGARLAASRLRARHDWAAAQVVALSRGLGRPIAVGYRWAEPRVVTGYRELLAETRLAFSGGRGRVTWQALGETRTPSGGRPMVGPMPR